MHGGYLNSLCMYLLEWHCMQLLFLLIAFFWGYCLFCLVVRYFENTDRRGLQWQINTFHDVSSCIKEIAFKTMEVDVDDLQY